MENEAKVGPKHSCLNLYTINSVIYKTKSHFDHIVFSKRFHVLLLCEQVAIFSVNRGKQLHFIARRLHTSQILYKIKENSQMYLYKI